jgi:hypothetical protein
MPGMSGPHDLFFVLARQLNDVEAKRPHAGKSKRADDPYRKV